MAYCAKCGTKNEDDVAYCVSCGANLNLRRRGRSQNYDNMCFGKSEGSNQYGWMIFGAIVLLVGLSLLLDEFFDIQIGIWPSIVIVIGVLIIVSAIMNQRSINR